MEIIYADRNCKYCRGSGINAPAGHIVTCGCLFAKQGELRRAGRTAEIAHRFRDGVPAVCIVCDKDYSKIDMSALRRLKHYCDNLDNCSGCIFSSGVDWPTQSCSLHTALEEADFTEKPQPPFMWTESAMKDIVETCGGDDYGD